MPGTQIAEFSWEKVKPIIHVRLFYSTYGKLGGPARPFGLPGTAGFVRGAQKSVHGAQEKAVGRPSTGSVFAFYVWCCLQLEAVVLGQFLHFTYGVGL